MQDDARFVLTERRLPLGLSGIISRIGVISFGLFVALTFEYLIVVAVGWLIVVGCAGLTAYEMLISPRTQGALIELTPDRISLGGRSLAAAEIEDIDYKKGGRAWDGRPLHVLSIRGRDGVPAMSVVLNHYVSGSEQADAVAEYVQALAHGEGVDKMKQRLERLADIAEVGRPDAHTR